MLYKYRFFDNEVKQINKSSKLISIMRSIKYLDTQDYYNILLLNKDSTQE